MNRLINESSPYLIQHAHNPVDWYPWGNEALQKAKDENKLIIVSIGYSSCHWCHVMERESFEREDVARVMNEHFVCIKIDREERPDIDQVYMNALQLMSGRGGWPLNCITLPDQRPIYGGTYFRREDWIRLLEQLARMYRERPEEAVDYAAKLTEGIRRSELVSLQTGEGAFGKDDLQTIFDAWKPYLDYSEGGNSGAPKFPVPNNFQFLLQYASLMKDDAASAIVQITLHKMAYGGIYDQLGGGFSRYSVDDVWKVPHFEKMLYDNAQLIELYTDAYQYNPLPLYKDVVYETIGFLQREMCSPEGAYFSALDADSEGVEGKFYIWTKQEIGQVLGSDAEVFSIYYNITAEGNWEDEQNILLRKYSDEELASMLGMTTEAILSVIRSSKIKLMEARDHRVRPGLDDKILTSWNALLLKALAKASRVFGEERFLRAAQQLAAFIRERLTFDEVLLRRSFKDGQASRIEAFLDDYALVAEAYVELYQADHNEQHLHRAKQLTDHVIRHFYDQDSGMFFYTSSSAEELIARKMETHDSVIPASNSVMAQLLHKLGLLFDEEGYTRMSVQMLKNIRQKIRTYPSAYSNWAMRLLAEVFPPYEVVIAGPEAVQRSGELDAYYIPNQLRLVSVQGSDLPLLRGKYDPSVTRIFVCEAKTCRLPVEHTADAWEQMKA